MSDERETSAMSDTEILSGEEEETFELEKIVSKRTKAGRVQYRIKWSGFPDSENTWENLDDLIADDYKEKIDRWEATENTSKSTSGLRRRRTSKTPPPRKTQAEAPPAPSTEASRYASVSAVKASPLILPCFGLAAVTTIAHAFFAYTYSEAQSAAMWQLRPMPSLLALIAVWFGHGTRDHYAKFLAVGLVWHTAAELLLAAIDASKLGCESGDCADWALVACIISHVALAYSNKAPSKQTDASLGLLGSLLLCASDIMLVLGVFKIPGVPDLHTMRYLAASVSVVVLSYSAMVV